MKVRGPQSKESAADGKEPLEDIGCRWWNIRDDLGQGAMSVGGREIESLLPLETLFGGGAGHEWQRPNHYGCDK